MKGSSSLFGIVAASGTALSLSVILATPANALVVNVGGQQWDVNTIETTFNDNSALLVAQPWWGDSALANDFATAVGSGLGFPNFSQPRNAAGLNCCGPLFASSRSFSTISAGLKFEFGDAFNATGFAETEVFTYATATQVPASAESVPGPLPLLGAAAAFGYSRKLRKTIKNGKFGSAGSAPPIS